MQPQQPIIPQCGPHVCHRVLKGSSQVQYGPFTTGGAINMVSTPIPQRMWGKAQLSYGSYNTLKSYVGFGNRHKHVGYVVEYLRYQSKGFRRDEPDNRTGFKRNDLIAKGFGTNRQPRRCEPPL